MVRNHLMAYFLFALIAVTGFQNTTLANSTNTQNGTTINSNTQKQNISSRQRNNLSTKQINLLKFAYKVAKEDGHKNPAILQGLIFKESNAGGAPIYNVTQDRDGGKNYGVGQIRIVAAREVFRKWPELYKKYGFQTRTDDEIIARLILDDHFNISIASKYLKIMSMRVQHDEKRALLAYNRGFGNARKVVPETDQYVRDVFRFKEKMINLFENN